MKEELRVELRTTLGAKGETGKKRILGGKRRRHLPHQHSRKKCLFFFRVRKRGGGALFRRGGESSKSEDGQIDRLLRSEKPGTVSRVNEESKFNRMGLESMEDVSLHKREETPLKRTLSD